MSEIVRVRDDVYVDVVDGRITLRIINPEGGDTRISLTNEAARMMAGKLFAAADLGDVTECSPGWDEIESRAKAYVRKCEKIAEAIQSPSWNSCDVQTVARAIL